MTRHICHRRGVAIAPVWVRAGETERRVNAA